MSPTTAMTPPAKLNLNPYDVVVLDRDLPGIHGDTICQTHHGQREPGDDPDADRRRQPERPGRRTRARGRRLPPQTLPLPRARPPSPRACPPQTHRPPPHPPAAGIELDPLTGTVTRNGQNIELTAKERAVLEALLRASPGALTAEQLLEQAWDENTDPFSNTVKTTIARLRRKLGQPPIIHTTPGIGYRISTTTPSRTTATAGEPVLRSTQASRR